VLVLCLTQCLNVLAQTPSYFNIIQPTLNANWTNSGLNVIKWVSAKEGVLTVDMQLVRLTVDGILPIAAGIPTSWGGFNVVLQDTPPGDDYFILLLDSGDTTMYSLSSRFSISTTASAAPASSALPSPVATATVSGAPNPTMQFAATYGVSGAVKLSSSMGLALVSATLCAMWISAGALWVGFA